MSTIEYQYQVLNITAVIGITALSWLAIEIHQWIEDKANNRN